MKETVKSRQEEAIKEIYLMLETLYCQGIISEIVYKGLTKRMDKIERDPLNLIIDLADTFVDVQTTDGRKFRLTINSKPL